MRVTRFCSRREYEKYMGGEVLRNRRDHHRAGEATTSRGFCFSEDEPSVAWEYLKGIVDCDVCMVLEFPEGALRKAQARYRNIYEPNAYDEMIVDEYCTEEYTSGTTKLVRVLWPGEFATDEEIAMCRLFAKMEM